MTWLSPLRATGGLAALAPVLALGTTQLIGFGTLMYAYTIVLPRIAEDLETTLAEVFGLFSLALFLGGLAAPLAGRLIDRVGGRPVMMAGSVAAAVALWALSQVTGLTGLFFAVIAAELAAMFVLYDAAFASVSQIRTGRAARRAISQITFVGGFASTLFWPVTLALTEAFGWRVALQLLAAAHLVISLPLLWWSLRTPTIDGDAPAVEARPDYPPLTGPDRRRALVWMVISFSVGGYVFGALMVHWVTGLTDMGLTAAAAVAAGALFGPAKVAGRMLEMAFGDRVHPVTVSHISLTLVLVSFGVLFLLGATPLSVALFAILFGMGDGLRAITRGTIPLALFGAKNYGTLLGWVGFIRMGVNASAPFAFAAVIEIWGGWTAFALMAGLIALALATMLPIQVPGRPEATKRPG